MNYLVLLKEYLVTIKLEMLTFEKKLKKNIVFLINSKQVKTQQQKNDIYTL